MWVNYCACHNWPHPLSDSSLAYDIYNPSLTSLCVCVCACGACVHVCAVVAIQLALFAPKGALLCGIAYYEWVSSESPLMADSSHACNNHLSVALSHLTVAAVALLQSTNQQTSTKQATRLCPGSTQPITLPW